MAIQSAAADIHLRSSSNFGLLSSSPFSITTWINASWTSGGRRSFVGLYGGNNDIPLESPVTSVQIGTGNSLGELTFWTWGGSPLCTTASGVMNPYNSVWCLIAYTFDGTNHLGYVNGVQVCSGAVANIPGYLNQVYINGYPGGITSEVSDHQVDQYALFTRTLSAGEILSMYNAGGSRHGINFSAKIRYEFDELSQSAPVTFVPDLSGNGNNLSVTGTGTNFTYTYINTQANSNIRPVQ